MSGPAYQQTAWYRKPQATFTDVFLLFAAISGGIFVMRHSPKTLMSFYAPVRVSLALLISSVPQLKMCKVQFSLCQFDPVVEVLLRT
jgi:hypothetical protein